MASAMMETETKPQIEPRLDGSVGPLRVVPLGGCGEFGMNMTVYEVNDERIIVDCGVMFPEHDMLGVDLVIPDISWLLEEPEKVKAIVLTHAHDDHIGGVPYVLAQLNAPVYGTPLTLAYLEAKLEEHDLPEDIELYELEYRKPVRVSDLFEVEAVHVTHSMPNAACLAIHTPAGRVVHTGDYKIDYAPVAGDSFDFFRLAQLGEEGVLALVGDSTNADVQGTTATEGWVDKHLDPIFASARRAIFCSTFSTSIHRIQILLDLAARHRRKVFVTGRSLERTFSLATEEGYLHVPRNLLRPISEIEDTPPGSRLILATGSQGEPMSAMSRLAVGEHQHTEVVEGDVVIISARIIPGHVRAVTRLVNHFCRSGAHVYDPITSKVHASGHAFREEMKAMISLTRPQYLLPVHGELRQQMSHRELALEMDFEPSSIFILEQGQALDLTPQVARISGTVPAGRTLVDGKTIGETGEVVLRDRQHLAEDGMLIAIINVNSKTGDLVTEPEIVTRGFVYVDESEDILNDLRRIVRDTFEACPREAREDSDVMYTEVRRALRKHIRKTYERFPLILPVVQEI